MEKKNRTLVGKVIGDARDKTIKVLVERRVKHPLYAKIVKRFKNYQVHDENNQFKTGDIVLIAATKRISKTKSWTVVSLAAKAA